MKRLSIALLFLLLHAIACEEELPEGVVRVDSGSEAEATYDESLLQEPQDPIANRVSNPNFDTEEDWFLCGQVDFGNSESAPEGSRVLVFGNTGDICEDGLIEDIGATAIQPITISQENVYLVISYWIKVEGEFSEELTSFKDDFEVFLGNQGVEGPNKFGYLVSSAQGEQYSDWTWVQHIVTKDQRDFYISDDPLYLEFRASLFRGDIKVYLDGVKVQEELEITSASPMPIELKNWGRKERIVFSNFTENTISTMAPNGSQLVNLDFIPADLSFYASWIDENAIAVPQIVFFPSEPTGGNVVPARATNFMKYPLDGGQEEQIYFTVGLPGEFNFVGSLDNRGATDVEVRDADWDLPRNRFAISIWARERSPEFVSDDFCTLSILDATTYEVLHEDTPGIYPKWSEDGRLAYFWDGALFVATVNGGNLTATQVYENGFDLLPALDWSPDGQHLVMAEKEGFGIVNNRFEEAYALKVLDIATGKARTILHINQGTLQQDLNWSPDGNFILYTLKMENGDFQIWWATVKERTTGPITNTISAGPLNFPP